MVAGQLPHDRLKVPAGAVMARPWHALLLVSSRRRVRLPGSPVRHRHLVCDSRMEGIARSIGGRIRVGHIVAQFEHAVVLAARHLAVANWLLASAFITS